MTCRMYRINEDGEPVSAEGIDVLQSIEERRVALDHVGGYTVSTVFINFDLGSGDGPPVLWETMAFGVGPWSYYQERYTSLGEAKAGHARIVKAIQSDE